MAENYEAPALLMVALLLIAAATPTAYGQGGIRANILGIVNIDIHGRLSEGNCNAPTTAISNATVSLNCTTGFGGPALTVGQDRTNGNGNFNITVNILGTSRPSACGIFVDDQLPVLNGTVCLALNTVNGTRSSLNATLTRLGGVVSNVSVPLNISVSTTA